MSLAGTFFKPNEINGLTDSISSFVNKRVFVKAAHGDLGGLRHGLAMPRFPCAIDSTHHATHGGNAKDRTKQKGPHTGVAFAARSGLLG